MSPIASIPDLYAHAIAIEREAAERYAELAERMRDESNEDLAALFAGMAAVEAGHLAALKQHGPCEIHRRSFEPVWTSLQQDLPF